jgi:hypothetical protein
LIAALLIERKISEIVELVLPIIQLEKGYYEDSFTKFVEALFDEFDFEKASNLVKELAKEA